jgi:hypothetical protein
MTSKKQKRNTKTRKIKKRHSSKKIVFHSSPVPPKRSVLYGGASGVGFPASFSNDIISSSPMGSYLPVNTYNDPNYLVVNSRNIPFRGGRKSRSNKQSGGGMSISQLGHMVSSGIQNQPDIIDKVNHTITTLPGVGLVASSLSGQSPQNLYSVPNKPLA